jgi:2-polyprenyl-6-methoxyphenol hydroxylase-like FAD-dependent oxidoreductase
MARLGECAIVIGGSLAGLMTARVCADHFTQVLVLERDNIEDDFTVHKSVPQGHHAHGLMIGGQLAMARLYPGFIEQLQCLGAVETRVGEHFVFLTPSGTSYSFGGAVKKPRYFGVNIYEQGRGLLEHCLRKCTKEFKNVEFLSNCAVQRLTCTDGRVHGVVCLDGGKPQSLEADLVADAGGRGSHAPRWLSELGFVPPKETVIGVDFAYTSAKFRIANYTEPARVFYAFGSGPNHPKMGFLAENEGQVWMLSLGGRFGDYPPTDEDGFLAFAKSLHTPMLYEMVKDAERVSDFSHFRFPTSLRRHYESLEKVPEGLIVVGDAVASFNPVYAQGMTSAALQAEALQLLFNQWSDTTSELRGLPQKFFARAAEVVSTPWALAAQSDFTFPQTRGERPVATDDSGSYLAAAEALSADDVQVQALLWNVFGLAKPLSVLWEEPLRSRVMERMRSMPQ